MKTLAILGAAAGIWLSVGSAFAYHPANANIQGTLEQEQRDRIDFEDTQRGVFRDTRSATPTRDGVRTARRGGTNSSPPYQTEHHTR